ncbi:MAG: ATP-binding cassette domain-containing protein [Nitrospiraceae bacterium]|nr:ATP-binding cassette domain-containing protein [Nitrospiraceae bacterium]
MSTQNVSKGFGGQPVLNDVSLTIHEGDRIGLMGRNGAGKSTLLGVIAGLDEPDTGLVTRCQGLRVALLSQQCGLDPGKTVAEVLDEAAADVLALVEAYHRASDALAASPPDNAEHRALEERCAGLHHALDVADAWNLTQDIKKVSVSLRLPPSDRLVGTLSGGEARRVDLAAALIRRPDLLLLDEPTNQIDTWSVEWLEDFIANYAGSCVLVTHDRYFLNRVVNRIVELEFNRIYSFPGNYTRFLELKSNLVKHEQRAETNRQSFLRRELTWLRRGPKARTSKDKGRIQRYYETEAETGPESHRNMCFEIPAPERLGKRILEARDVSFGYDENALFKGFDFLMLKGMRVGIVGPNGCGKTSLLRVLMGHEEPLSGEVFRGERTHILYVDQTKEEVDPNETVLQHVSNGESYFPIGDRKLFVPTYLERFLFDRNTVRVPMKNLSGGETNRVVLAKKLLRGGNLLILDEPTNDLDLATLRVLEEAINSFDGCAFIVSHDRYFLNRVCTHLLVFLDNGEILQLAGNYDDYLAYKKRIAAETPAQKRPRKARPDKKASPNGQPRRLTWKENKELEGIEAAIEATEAELAELETRVASPDFYRANTLDPDTAGDDIKRTFAALESARAKVETLYARWAELDTLKK